MGLRVSAGETRLAERARELLAKGPAASVPLIEFICQMPGAPTVVAEQMAIALFADRPEFARDADGRWTLLTEAQQQAARFSSEISGSELKAAGASVLAEARRSQSPRPRPAVPAPDLAHLTYAVVDCETTGMHPASGDRITEIAVVVVRDGKPAETFDTLVNPERPIPPFITSLTHISHEMVKDAPRFADIADELLRVMQGHVFVAHNADFDWKFVRAEIARTTGRRLSGPKLCTVKLARRILPQLPSRRLDALSHYYGVGNDARHRAGGDALATAKILLRLLAEARDRECHSWDDLQVLLGARARGNRPRRPPAMPQPMKRDDSA